MNQCISLIFSLILWLYYCWGFSKLLMKFNIKDKVKLIAPVSYLKTSDNMPMLRPPELVAIDEIGEILSIRSPDTVEVKFRRGSFLIDIDKIEKILT